MILVDNNICSNQTIRVIGLHFFARAFDTACRRDDRVAASSRQGKEMVVRVKCLRLFAALAAAVQTTSVLSTVRSGDSATEQFKLKTPAANRQNNR